MEKIDFKMNMPQAAIRHKQELLKSLLKHPQIIDFKKQYGVDDDFIERHLGQFKMWLDELALCETCNGLDECKQSRTGYVLDLRVKMGF